MGEEYGASRVASRAAANYMGGERLPPVYKAATTIRRRERQGVDERRTVCRDQGTVGGFYLIEKTRISTTPSRSGSAEPVGHERQYRGTAIMVLTSSAARANVWGSEDAVDQVRAEVGRRPTEQTRDAC